MSEHIPFRLRIPARALVLNYLFSMRGPKTGRKKYTQD